MCLKTLLVVLLIYIGSFSSTAQQQYCRKVQINNSKMHGECCVFVKDENINLHEEVDEALSQVSLIREPQANNDFTIQNPSSTGELPHYHRNNSPPNQKSPNKKDTEDSQPNGSSLLPNIKEKPNNQFDNPIIMKFQSNNRGAENQFPIKTIGPENLQSGGHLHRDNHHRGVSRPTDQNIRPIETSHRDSTLPLLQEDPPKRDFEPNSHRKTAIIENSMMTKNNRVRPQDTPVILNKKRPQDIVGMSDNFPPRRQDNPEMSDNYPPRRQNNPEVSRLPQTRPQENPSFENRRPIINRDDSMGQKFQPNEEPFTRPNTVHRLNSPPLQRNHQKTNVNADKEVSVSPNDPNQTTIKPLIKSTTEDDSSDIVFLPDEQPMAVPKVVENQTVTSNVSGVVVDNRNAVGAPNERVLPNGDPAIEF